MLFLGSIDFAALPDTRPERGLVTAKAPRPPESSARLDSFRLQRVKRDSLEWAGLTTTKPTCLSDAFWKKKRVLSLEVSTR